MGKPKKKIKNEIRVCDSYLIGAEKPRSYLIGVVRLCTQSMIVELYEISMIVELYDFYAFSVSHYVWLEGL